MKKLVVVDGYNVIYSSEYLKRILRRSLYQAQAKLINLVLNYCCFEMIQGYVVFDAYRRPYPDTKEEISPELKVIFTGKGKTADSYIEKFVFQRKSRYDCIYVITSDYSQGMTVMDKKVLLISPERFLEELTFRQKTLNKRYNRSSSLDSHPRLSDCLKREAREKLKNLRG